MSSALQLRQVAEKLGERSRDCIRPNADRDNPEKSPYASELPRTTCCDTFASRIATLGPAAMRQWRVSMTGLIVIAAVLVVIVLLLAGIYNGLVQLRVRSDSAWSDIDVQLKRRHDLIPNLVETVKGYAAHEKGTFENIARYRSAAMSASGPEAQAQAEGQL